MTDVPPAPEPAPQPNPEVAPHTYAQPTYSQPAPGYTPPAPGYAAPYGQAYAAPAKTNTLAIVSLILSIAGLFVPLASIAGIVTGHISLNQIKRTNEGGRGLGLAGTIIGYVVTALGLIAIIAYVIFIFVVIGAGVASSSTSDF